MDKEGNGMVDAKELRDAFCKCAIEMPDEEVDRVIERIDFHGNGKINFQEFLVATIDQKSVLSEDAIYALF